MEPLAEVPTFLNNRPWRIELGSRLLAASRAMASRSVRGHSRISRLARRLIGDRYIEVPYLGKGSIWICPAHTTGEDVARHGVYEPQVIRAVQTFVSDGFSFVDVGANIGLHTVAAGLCKVSGEQRFIAFEPEPRSFLLLKKNCGVNRLEFVDTLEAALGSQEGTADLYISTTYNQTHHGLVQHSDQVRISSCSVTSLDRIFLSGPRRFTGAVLLKIDVEGTELEVLKGGLRWLREIETLAVICEVFPDLLRRSGHSPTDLLGLLQEIGCDQLLATDDNSRDPWRSIDAGSIHGLRNTFVNVLATKGPAARKISESLTA